MNETQTEADATPGPVLYVCTTCRRGEGASDNPPGQQLHDALAARAERVAVREVACLAACDRGCTAFLAQEGHWGWLLGNLGPEKASDILHYVDLYAASRTGTVMPSRRPASLSDMVLGRMPAAVISLKEPS
ncbi:hypothetical protein AA103196_0949 [Ameyamaea chiangmaiensis NBRC 103196]|uniref:DUF1636 domain-containing protein n=1 Tax=Ameyamaea chiangmaiensis TaxID=442969 RepID=A0A850PFR5_9PROT|nr:DUF1636 domain-containing protein [Ameyamaea chiangmaiensis]MBS4076249.1 DUF1636 domain-containing protein [Ameyamaea chiangmaiensis]NVN41479.1 DUF1636 domain-containing protein [Ameyamaea chiangmaiensis]GBQ64706.1 hypothetical protein AA103196_0949 [Ameyamaea chiangmaiensis NBRC 103196]